jgi:uncharacterized protein (TIGR03382 family)
MLRAMRRSVAVFVVVHLCLVKLASAGTGPDPIIGGQPATVGEFPSVVAIEVGNGLCTGTLVTKDWVLTAAHCVTPSVVGLSTQAQVTASVKVHFNTVNIRSSAGMVVGASDTIPDPMFNINALGSHDSGLIKLASSVTTVTPLRVNFVPADAPVGVTVTMVGFGATAVGPSGNVGIEYTVMQTSTSCMAVAGMNIGADANLLCYSQTTNTGKCEGDSGGPSFAMISGKLVEVGITSFGDQTCGTFGADTRTDAEKAFLIAHVPELECQSDADCDSGHECFNHTCIVTPFQPMGLGSMCTSGADCESGTCAAGDGGMKCSMVCDPTAMMACPSGFTCLSAGSGATQGACWPESGGGCCDAGGSGAPATMIIGIALVGIVLRRRR